MNKRRLIGVLLLVLGVVFFFLLLFFILRNGTRLGGDGENGSSAQFPQDDLSLVDSDLMINKERETMSLLNGEAVDYLHVGRRVLGVMVENSIEARPYQRGLSQADVVYETLVEGGITRFLALFQANDVEAIGPVRSVRPYFLDWLIEYDAPIVHDGGSKAALGLLAGDYSFIDDLPAGNFPEAFWRDKELLKKVVWEHTLFTSVENLRKVVEEKGLTEWTAPEVWFFSENSPYSTAPMAKKIMVDFSREPFNVVYEYDEDDETYHRFMRGVPHLDFASGAQLAPRNLVVMETDINLKAGVNPLGWMEVRTVGEGAAWFFSGGRVVTGKWKKEEVESRLLFYDEDGREVVFAPGQIWISAVAGEGMVRFE